MSEEAFYRIERGYSIGNWFAGISKSYGLDAVPPKICVHPHLETDRKYSARNIFDAAQFFFVESDETRMMGLPDAQKSFKIGLAV